MCGSSFSELEPETYVTEKVRAAMFHPTDYDVARGLLPSARERSLAAVMQAELCTVEGAHSDPSQYDPGAVPDTESVAVGSATTQAKLQKPQGSGSAAADIQHAVQVQEDMWAEPSPDAAAPTPTAPVMVVSPQAAQGSGSAAAMPAPVTTVAQASAAKSSTPPPPGPPPRLKPEAPRDMTCSGLRASRSR